MKTIIWALAIVAGLGGWATHSEARFVGDMNADGVVGVLDSTLITREIAGVVTPSSVFPSVLGCRE